MLGMRNVGVCVLITVAMLAGGGASAQTADEAKKQIQMVYDKVNAAGARKDIKGVLSAYTSDYTSTMPSGQKRTLAELRQRLPQFFALMVSMKAVSKVTAVTVKGKQYTAQLRSHMELKTNDPQTKKVSVIVVDTVEEDVWVKQGGVWKNKQGKIVSSKQSVDGISKPSP